MADRSTGDTSLPPRAAEFLELRPLLFAFAYRVLGRVTEAEDVVQDTWLHYQDVTEQPRSPKAYLSTEIGRASCRERVEASGGGASGRGRGDGTGRGEEGRERRRVTRKR